jgi:hypothetical protein
VSIYQKQVIVLSPPGPEDYVQLAAMLNAAENRRLGFSLCDVWSYLGVPSGKLLLPEDAFINQVREILKPTASSHSNQKKKKYNVNDVMVALKEYAQLIQLYTSKQVLLALEDDEDFKTKLQACTVHATFKQHFDIISAPVIEGWKALFDNRLRLAHESWALLSWKERAVLKSSFLAQNLIRYLNKVRYSLHRSSVWLMIQNNKLVYVCFAAPKTRSSQDNSGSSNHYDRGALSEINECPFQEDSGYSWAGGGMC